LRDAGKSRISSAGFFDTGNRTTRERVSVPKTRSLAGASCLYYPPNVCFETLPGVRINATAGEFSGKNLLAVRYS
jgi:hypothetical protein